MNISKKLHNNKGYTLIELMITLFIFAIITMFGVPAFYAFIESSRAKSQVIHAANFLRSAQEIASATNRTIYVYTAGYFDYSNHKEDYWYQDWIMSFKPIGDNLREISQQDTALNDNAGNYLISRQTIFTPSAALNLFVIDSANHNAVDLASVTSDAAGDTIEMDGYSHVRSSHHIQGASEDQGKPTYMTFHPSGSITMPIFIVAEGGENQTFDTTHIQNNMANHWAELRNEFDTPIAILAGCRTARGLNIDAVNYTFNRAVIDADYIFDTPVEMGRDNKKYYAAPSFGHYLCGSSFLQ